LAITSVEQEFEFIERQNNYKTSTRTTYGGRGQPMDIGKSNENFKNGKPKCFNYNKCRYMAKECRSEKKEQEIRTCFKYDKKRYIAKDCKGKQMIKKQKIQEESDEDKKNKQDFGEDLE